MSIEIDLEGKDADASTRDLRDWLRRDALDAEVKPAVPVPGTLGAGFVAGLLLALKTRTVDHLVTSLQTWIKVRRPQVKLTFKAKGRSLTLDLQNTVVDEELINNLKSLLAEVQ